MKKRIQALVFDFGEVISHFSHRAAAENILNLAAITSRQAVDALYQWLFHLPTPETCPNALLETNRLSKHDFVTQLKASIGDPGLNAVPAERIAEAFSDIFTPNTAVTDMLRRLPRNVQLVLASNTNRMHYAHFGTQFREVLRLFNDQVLSFNVGHRKPAAEFFDAVAAAAGCGRDECLFIDDLLPNVEAARRFGLNAVHYTPHTDLERELSLAGVPLLPDVAPQLAREPICQFADSLAAAFSFVPTSPRRLAGNATEFLVFPPQPSSLDELPPMYLDAGLSFLGKLRLKSFPRRFVLVPKGNVGASRTEHRWALTADDVDDWIVWSHRMSHVVTFSTLKSGASDPFRSHAQSFPVRIGTGDEPEAIMTALRPAHAGPLIVDSGAVPQFDRLRIMELAGYPVRGMAIQLSDMGEGRRQAARKVYELSLNWDSGKSFNIVVVPAPDGAAPPTVYFFPRNRAGRAIFTRGKLRWQVAALELAGVICPGDPALAREIDLQLLYQLFQETTCGVEEFQDFKNLAYTF